MSRYTSEIKGKVLNLEYYALENLYKSIRTSTRFRFEAGFLENQKGLFCIILTAKYFDYFDYSDHQVYRYYLLSNDHRRSLIKIINGFDDSLKNVTDEECVTHLEKMGYRQVRTACFDSKQAKQAKQVEEFNTSDELTRLNLALIDDQVTITNAMVFDDFDKVSWDALNSKRNGPNYYLNGVEHKILMKRSSCFEMDDNTGEVKVNQNNETIFLVTKEEKDILVADMKKFGLIKSIKFRGKEIINKIPPEKRAKDEESLMYKDIINAFIGSSFIKEMVIIDMQHLTEDELKIYLGIYAHSLLTVQVLDMIKTSQ